MRVWLQRLLKLLLLGAVLLGAMAAGAYWIANRPAQPIEQAEMRQRFDQVRQWVRHNEALVLTDGNAALWWMMQTAARRTADPYLNDLTARAFVQHFPAHWPAPAWKRILDPKAEVMARAPGLDSLASYQRFLHHALTCVPLDIPEGQTTVFVERNMCRPMLSKVLWSDPVCTTHQLIGLDVIRQTNCHLSQPLEPLESELLDDIEWQLTWDPIMRDPHYQRVLALAWHDRAEAIKPIWLRRMLDAQDADGGWRGYRRIPELPSWVQPWHWREHIARRWPDKVSPDIKERDFHSTAQALLTLALLIHQEPTAAAKGAPDR